MIRAIQELHNLVTTGGSAIGTKSRKMKQKSLRGHFAGRGKNSATQGKSRGTARGSK